MSNAKKGKAREKQRRKEALKSPSQKKPTLSSVKGDYFMPENTRIKYGLDKILKVEARSWTNVERLVDSYFANTATWDQNGEELLKDLINGLRNFSRSSKEKKSIREYASRIVNYLQGKAMQNKFLRYYILKEKEATLLRQQVLARLEGDTTGAILSRLGAKRLGEQESQVIY
jgi:hypothetical protein